MRVSALVIGSRLFPLRVGDWSMHRVADPVMGRQLREAVVRRAHVFPHRDEVRDGLLASSPTASRASSRPKNISTRVASPSRARV
jgi:hypothetical protein